MSYRERLYSKYVSTHTAAMYVDVTVESMAKQFPAWRYRFQTLLPSYLDARILDIGCGSGAFVQFLHRTGYQSAMGVDGSREQVELSQKLGIGQVVCADLFGYLAGEDATFDVILARDVIEHLDKEEVLRAFDAVHRALKPGGVFIIQAPNGESPLVGRILYGDFTHELCFTRTSLNQIFLVTGFGSVQYYPVGPAPLGLRSGIRYCVWKVMESAVRLYVLAETGSAHGIFTQNIIGVGRKQDSSTR